MQISCHSHRIVVGTLRQNFLAPKGVNVNFQKRQFSLKPLTQDFHDH